MISENISDLMLSSSLVDKGRERECVFRFASYCNTVIKIMLVFVIMIPMSVNLKIYLSANIYWKEKVKGLSGHYHFKTVQSMGDDLDGIL